MDGKKSKGNYLGTWQWKNFKKKRRNCGRAPMCSVVYCAYRTSCVFDTLFTFRSGAVVLLCLVWYWNGSVSTEDRGMRFYLNHR